jgi:predicted glutamine amidotransferase
MHGDGWGIAYLDKKGKWVIKKSTKAIYEDPLVDELRELKTNLCMIHMRKKIGSETAFENTHPFSIEKKKYGSFVFCHNGFIDEEINFDTTFQLKGKTDSEKLFYSILTDMKKDNIKKAIRKNFKKHSKLKGTNIILSSRKKSVVAVRKNSFTKYYQMSIGRGNDMIVVSSEHLGNLKGLFWEHVEQGDILDINHETLKISISKEKKGFQDKIFSKFKRAKIYITQNQLQNYLRGIANEN